MTTFVLGGGPAGLAVVDGLGDSGLAEFILIERGASLGGLAQTVEWKGVGRHDLGPHKIFTIDRALMQRVENLLPPEQWLTREKVSSIYMNGHFLGYPPSPFSLAGVFGIPRFVRMVASYGMARIASLARAPEPKTFEEDLSQRVGAELYEVLFKPIALKLWGDPKRLDVKLSRGRVQTPSIVEVIARLLRLRRTSEFEALTFRYPRGGLGEIWKSVERKGAGRGKFLAGCRITSLEIVGRRIAAIHHERADTGQKTVIQVEKGDFVVSTLPLGVLPELMPSIIDESMRKTIEQMIVLNDLLLAFFHVATPSMLKESWIFVPDPKIVFHRLSEQESFDPAMTPQGSIVCCEIMSNELRPMALKPDAELCKLAEQGIRDMGYRDARILAQRVIRLPRSYPVYRPGYQEALRGILARLDGLENFRTIGRQGSFNYVGTLDAMDMGYGCARWLASGRPQDWGAERERTDHYPVLD